MIPAGTFVQAQLEKLSRHGSRREFCMKSLALLFPNGYAANNESDEGTAWSNPSGRAKARAILAPAVGAGRSMSKSEHRWR